MKSKKVLALIMGAIIASSGMSQMAMQVYAHGEESISSSKHMKDGSDAEKLYKLPNFTRRSVERFLNRKPLEIEDLSNLYISPTSRLVFKPGLNQEAKLVGLAEKVNFNGDIVIPEKVSINGETYSVTSIGNAAFRGYKYIQLKSLPKSLKIIGERAFFNCTKLKLGELPTNLREIGSEAFANCSALELEKLPGNLEVIGEGAFADCSKLRLETLPANLHEISNDAFANCKNLQLKSLPGGLTKIGNDAFTNCIKLQLEELPSNIEIIGKGSFENCIKLKSIALPTNLSEIGRNAFANCRNLELTELPTNLSKIGRFAFDHCSNVRLKSLPAQLSEIDKGAFYNTGIRTITIPASVTKLGDSAFDTYSIEKINLEQGSILKSDDIKKAYGKQLDRILDAAWQEQETTTQNEVNVENDGRECSICQWEFDERYDTFVGTLPCGHGKYLEGFSDVEYDFRQGNMIFMCPECGRVYYV